MKIKLVFLLLSLFPSASFSQTISITITGENRGLEAVHIIKGNQVIAISDSLGKVSIPVFSKDSVITLSHLLYEEMTLTAPTSDTLLSMRPRVFHIGQTTYSLKDGWPLLKKIMKSGISLGHSLKTDYTFSSMDTVYTYDRKLLFSLNGSALFYSSKKRPIVKINNITTENNGQKSLVPKNKKEIRRWFTSSKQTLLMIGQYYGLLLYGSEPLDGLIVEYKGKEENRDVFCFYLPPFSLNNNAKVRGLAYINSELGLLERVQVTLTPIDVHVSNLYEMDITYTSFDSSNSFLPSDFQEISYKLAEDRSVISENRSHLTVYY